MSADKESEHTKYSAFFSEARGRVFGKIILNVTSANGAGFRFLHGGVEPLDALIAQESLNEIIHGRWIALMQKCQITLPTLQELSEANASVETECWRALSKYKVNIKCLQKILMFVSLSLNVHDESKVACRFRSGPNVCDKITRNLRDR